MLERIISFVTGGLPSEIAKQVGEHLRAKGKAEIAKFKSELAYDLKVLEVTKGDKLFTRQGIAWTFHIFMWFTKIWTGSFPQDTIFQWGETSVTIGFIYIIIIGFYYPFRAVEKFKGIIR